LGIGVEEGNNAGIEKYLEVFQQTKKAGLIGGAWREYSDFVN
jgi:hypothetical protein